MNQIEHYAQSQNFKSGSSNEKVTPELQQKMIQLSELIDIFSQNMILYEFKILENFRKIA